MSTAYSYDRETKRNIWGLQPLKTVSSHDDPVGGSKGFTIVPIHLTPAPGLHLSGSHHRQQPGCCQDLGARDLASFRYYI